MATKSSFWSNSILSLLFNGTSVPNIAINATTAPLTNLYISLHTTSPGAGGNQSVNEATYGGYARVAVARTSGGWTVSGNSVSPTAPIVFPACTSGTETEAWVGIGTAISGTNTLLYFGQLSPSINVFVGSVPTLNTTSTITEV